MELARQLGADVVVDHRAEDFTAAVDDATQGAGVDVVFDGVGGEDGDREVDFTDLPAALDATEDRATVGRVVVHLTR